MKIVLEICSKLIQENPNHKKPRYHSLPKFPPIYNKDSKNENSIRNLFLKNIYISIFQKYNISKTGTKFMVIFKLIIN